MPKGEEAGTGSPVIAADTLNLWRHVRSGCRTLAAALGVHAVNRVRVRQGSQSLDSAGICAKVDLVTASHALLFRMRALVVAQGINPTRPSAFRRLAENLAAREGFLLGGKGALANCAMA